MTTRARKHEPTQNHTNQRNKPNPQTMPKTIHPTHEPKRLHRLHKKTKQQPNPLHIPISKLTPAVIDEYEAAKKNKTLILEPLSNLAKKALTFFRALTRSGLCAFFGAYNRDDLSVF